jgi:hypothetical protein
LSNLFPIADATIMTVRHMESQVWVQLMVVIAGYGLLVVLGYHWRTILYVLWVGCMLTFMMESALFVSRVRPPNVQVLIYETLILTNQGIPYLLVIRDKILPPLRGRLALPRYPRDERPLSRVSHVWHAAGIWPLSFLNMTCHIPGMEASPKGCPA